MHAPRLIVGIMLVSFLSGCFGGDEGGTSGTTDSTTPTDSSAASPGATGTGGTSQPPPTNETMEPPVASFEVAPADSNETNLTAGGELVFDGSASMDPEGGELTFEWDLGDGNSSAGMTVNHTYDAEGNYTVLLNVTSDASGLSDTEEAIFEVGPGAGPPLIREGSTDRLVLFCSPDEYHFYEEEVYVGWNFKAEPASLVVEWWSGDETLVEETGAEGVVPEGTDNFGVCPPEFPPLAVGMDYKITLWAPGSQPP